MPGATYNRPVEHVSSRNNIRVKRFREVARLGRDGNTVLLDGAHLVEEALRSSVELEVVAFSETAFTRDTLLPDACIRAGAAVLTLPDALLDSISPVRHASGVVALARIEPAELSGAVTAGPPQLIMILDAVQDPGNVGAIVRSAEACGGTAVIAGHGSADPFGWKALRGSMGSALRLPVVSVDTLGRAMTSMRQAGIRTFAAVPHGGTPLHRANLGVPSAVLLGGEGAGLTRDLLDQADERLTIEMRRPVESLNVSVAAALVLYEASRQRANVAVR